MQYQLIAGTITDEEGGLHNTYGIRAVNEDGTVAEEINDVFCDKQAAINFVNMCNDKQLSCIHLEDAIDDALV